jgi:hypothetical protein
MRSLVESDFHDVAGWSGGMFLSRRVDITSSDSGDAVLG